MTKEIQTLAILEFLSGTVLIVDDSKEDMYPVAKELMGREVDTFEMASEKIDTLQSLLLDQLPYFKGILNEMAELLDKVGPVKDLETSKLFMDDLKGLVTQFEEDFGSLHTVETIPPET
jgi:hypothetical protein